MTVSNLQVQVFLACLACSGLASAGEIQVTLKPGKPVYVLGEPVVCDLAIKNVSTQDLLIMFSYPNYMGLSFVEHEPPIPELGYAIDMIVPLVKFTAQKEYRVKMALNRFVPMSRTGQYRVHYQTWHAFHLASDGGKGPPRHSSEKGVLEFTVVAGVLTEETLKSFADALDQKESSKVMEAIEALIWLDDPKAIALLRKASRLTVAKGAAPELEYEGRCILYGLGKFLHLDEAKSVLFDIAAEDLGSDMAIAYQICMAKRIHVPDSIVKGGLASSDDGKKYSSLEYLFRCGTPVQAEWVVPLTKDERADIRALAEKVLAKFKEDAEKKREK